MWKLKSLFCNFTSFFLNSHYSFCSTPSPHRTPPPQRQGVIQRHNTGSKPPSPAPSRLAQSHFGHYLPGKKHFQFFPNSLETYLELSRPSGHDALSNLVDVAVAQPSLPVPNENSRRPHITVSESQPQSLQQQQQQQQQQPRDRYTQYLHPVEVAALQQQQVS